MGNTQSASSARQDSASQKPESSNDPVVTRSPPDPFATEFPSAQMPPQKEEGSASGLTTGRRSRLTKLCSFPSLKRRGSVAGLSNESRVGSVNPSPSRRRWRSFSGLKKRPVSTLTDPEVPSGETTLEAPISSIPEEGSSGKGKRSDTGPWEQESEPRQMEDTTLRRLRQPQGMLSDPQSTTERASDADDSKNQTERPSTPIPSSAIEPTPILEGDGAGLATGSNSPLTESLGPWPRGQPSGRTGNSFNDASGPHSQSGLPPTLSHPANVSPSGPSTPALLDAPSRPPRRTLSTAGPIPSFTVPPTPPADNGRFGRNPTPTQERRTLPPAGTGTLVVVQGVVHTTDVRHNRPHSPSRSQAPSVSTRPPRSSSSTPTLRPPSRRSHSRSPSRASTPQPQSSLRRGRFSSLTSSLRPRSRPGTPSSRRSVGTGGWGPHSLSSSSTNRANETALDSGENFRLSVDSSRSGSRNTVSTSPLPPSTPSPDVSVGEPHPESQVEVVNAIDDLPLEQSSQLVSGEETQPANGQTGAHVNDVDGDGSDESEAELSASSIEVLGTLLSVATAATAASLVTGTTDPLFSSGLAGPSMNAMSNNAASPPQGIPSANSAPSSTQDAGSPLLTEPGIDESNAEAAVNTRMRAAWESLRDRFSRTRGRRGAVAAGTEGREDPREQMLREMARAFNTGLGLGPDDDRERLGPGWRDGNEGIPSENAATPNIFPSPNDPLSPEVDGGAAPEPGLGPGAEGSFERFLHNLQVDLRTALTEDYAARRARAQVRDSRRATGTSNDAEQGHASTEAPSSGSSEPLDSHDRHGEAAIAQSDADGEPSIPPPLTSNVPNTPRPAVLDLPSLPGDTEMSGDGFGTARAPPQAHGITGQPGAGVNWWRLYRFPPMQLAPHPSSPAVGGTSTRAPPSEHPPASRDEGADPHSQTFPLPSGDPQATPSQNVVPVIVVGLQSVPVTGVGAPYHHHNHDPPSPLDTHTFNGDSDSLPDPPVRERAWPLRAASRALGRMNRRGEPDSSTDDGIPPGGDRPDPTSPRDGRRSGRTYLIFVIGGYYPPNHSIVTGADDMNSFEALWELAELLGQVKPPVASKEDIEKSGLEIIKASSLSDYEQAGKVASNTVERCLICLDDYECEDDLRLLSCRHIFHKQCVDKWLEQGRNNCPACRTKGVRTPGDESPNPIPTSD